MKKNLNTFILFVSLSTISLNSFAEQGCIKRIEEQNSSIAQQILKEKKKANRSMVAQGVLAILTNAVVPGIGIVCFGGAISTGIYNKVYDKQLMSTAMLLNVSEMIENDKMFSSEDHKKLSVFNNLKSFIEKKIKSQISDKKLAEFILAEEQKSDSLFCEVKDKNKVILKPLTKQMKKKLLTSFLAQGGTYDHSIEEVDSQR